MEIVDYPNESKCKKGFFDAILKKWFGNPFSDDGMYFCKSNISKSVDILKYDMLWVLVSQSSLHYLTCFLNDKEVLKNQSILSDKKKR